MFAAIASGNPLQMSEELPNSNGLQHTVVLSSTKPKSYSHITLFILPNVTFPQEYIANVYFKISATEDFKLFGYLASEKPSAIFKVKLPNMMDSSSQDDGLGEIDMDEDYTGLPSDGSIKMDNSDGNNISQLLIGISIEPRNEGMLKLQEIRNQNKAATSSSLVLAKPNVNSVQITTAGQLAKMYPVLTHDLAAKIVQHAYNYLSGFLDSNGDVNIKRFDTWWDKFRKRLANDGTFLDEVTTE
ncbi:hypothetical protein KAFR_0D01310 [Kazachstania africana CBS 2517]|uniref:Uncharacterized protein n=1 Tax=Kazachstania africana (strain ATCC 22294 / BCRC 22015 / CBS 2517 / CECT 1963 / NBRC 1671 / NRRL Y-8276) TaxID=1071382 RepID=H2ATS7_KAZAF|nr:hypothetical protein KAFR_0D01310 [Kazachstania africana CBS 2517]CCF57777.1 hypothetical protein KAFR_0D01310 [Kazachstania africana CBS 2517]